MAVINDAKLVYIDPTTGCVGYGGTAIGEGWAEYLISSVPAYLQDHAIRPSEVEMFSDANMSVSMISGGALEAANVVVMQKDKTDGGKVTIQETPTPVLLPDYEWYGIGSAKPYALCGHFSIFAGEYGTTGVIHHIGGHIIGLTDADATVNLPVGNCYLFDMTDTSEPKVLETSTLLKVGSDRLDFYQTANAPFNDGTKRFLCAGVAKYTDADPSALTFDSLAIVTVNNAQPFDLPTITLKTLTGDEVLNALPQMRNGAGVTFYFEGGAHKTYFISSMGYLAFDSQFHSFAILIYDHVAETATVVKGPLFTAYIAEKRFVMTGSKAVMATGAKAGKIFYYGSVNGNYNELMNNIIEFQMADNSYIVHSSNDNVNIRVSGISATHTPAIPAYEDYYPITGTPTFANSELIFGGLINS